MTNGDRVRQMSDEELCEFFYGEEAYTTMRLIPITGEVPPDGITMVNGVFYRAIPVLEWLRMDED